MRGELGNQKDSGGTWGSGAIKKATKSCRFGRKKRSLSHEVILCGGSAKKEKDENSGGFSG